MPVSLAVASPLDCAVWPRSAHIGAHFSPLFPADSLGLDLRCVSMVRPARE